MDTYFAPAARVSRAQLIGQVKRISNSPVMNAVLQTAAGLMVVINEQRQIVSFNHSFLETLGITEPETVLGLRLGETLHCAYAFDEPGGCGTTPYCSSCGAAIAMVASIDDNVPCEKTCALKTERNGQTEELCLLVRAQPFVVNRRRWILVYAQDVTRQQFWANLEDVFFHDVNNMLCSVKNISHYLYDHLPENELVYRLKLVTDRLCKEITMQETLSHYKDRQQIVNLSPTRLHSIKDQVFSTVLNKRVSDDKVLIEEGSAEDREIVTDPMLVARVLTNMLLNAFEATSEGGSVTFRTLVEKSRVTWAVWNSACIPENIQLRIFQKFFSTKPVRGHGLGTYSMKFFGEECLGGTVSFTSTVENGTTFVFSLPEGTVSPEQ